MAVSYGNNKVYNKGKTGKEYGYNQMTGNIAVNGKSVLNDGSDIYKKTLAAMQADTGKSYGQVDSSFGDGADGYVLGAGGATQYKTNNASGNRFSSNGIEQNTAYQTYLDNAQKQALSASNASIQQQINNLQSQIPGINQTYQSVYKDLYQNQLNSQKNLPQLMAAQGLTGGATESTISEMQNNYSNLLNQSKLAEQNALAEIRNQINNAQLTGTVTNANIASDYANQMAELQLQQQQLADERAYNEQLTAKDEQSNIYKQLLNMGIVNQEIADYYGVPLSQLKSTLMPATTATTSKSKSSGGGSSSSKTKGLTYAQAMAAYNKGIKTPSVISVLNSYLGDGWAGETSGNSNTRSVGLPAQNTDNVLASIKKNNPLNIKSVNQMMLENAYTTGQINDTQLKTLAKQLGVIIK